MKQYEKYLKKLLEKAQLPAVVKAITPLLALIFCASAIMLSSHLWHGDILFHTDVSRDFLVMQDIVETKDLTLIGPRSGGVPGVFHGPAWYYVNLIPFIAFGGNPVAMGWWWWFLGVSSALLFIVVIRLATKSWNLGLLGGIAFAFLLLFESAGPINPFLANMLSFAVMALWAWWMHQPQLWKAVLGWFGLGMLVQFQMAFAIPVIIAWGPYFLYWCVRHKLYYQILTPAVLALPLSTFLLFDLRHDWLQLNSVLRYLSEKPNTGRAINELVMSRMGDMLTLGIHLYVIPLWSTVTFLTLVGLAYRDSKDSFFKNLVTVFGIWYVGWWTVTLFYSGQLWNYYYSPFFSMFLFVLCVGAKQSKKLLMALCVLLILGYPFASRAFFYTPQRFDSSSWKLLSTIAQESLNEPNMGYFVYSQDQFAYSLKYAFSYYAKNHPELSVQPFKKMPSTVLVESSDDPKNPFMSADIWQFNQINISEKPISVKTYPFGLRVERYELDAEAQAVPIDPNLILDLHFR